MLTKDEAIAKYKLEPLAEEGGYYRRVYESADKNADARRYAASIYYLLQAPDFSCFHRIDCDELWHFYGGSDIALYLIDSNGQLQKTVMGSALQAGDAVPYVFIPRNSWFAAEVKDGNGLAMIGCTTVPEFLFHTFEVKPRAELIADYPQHVEIITRFTRF